MTPSTGRLSPKTPRNPNGYAATDVSIKPKGPPRTYSPEAAQYVVGHIVNGGHISKLIEEGVISCNQNLQDWMKYDEALADAVARAQESRAELWADQLIEIADNPTLAPDDKRVRIDARWKVIGALLHRRYGVKQTVDINQNINVAVVHAEQLMQLTRAARDSALATIEAQVIEDRSLSKGEQVK
jgi:hypothetical protein